VSGSIVAFGSTQPTLGPSSYSAEIGPWPQFEALLNTAPPPAQTTTNLVLFGDSITGGAGASSPTNAYAYLLCAAQNLREWDYAISGSQISDELANIYSSVASRLNIRLILTGYNDMRNLGIYQPFLLHYQGCLLTALAWGSLPPGLAAWPTANPTAGWTNTTIYGLTNRYVAASAAGATYSLTLSGRYFFIELVRLGHGGGTCSVSLDGVLQTNVALSGGSLDYMENPDSSTMIILSSATNAQHQVAVSCLGDGLATLGWSAGWDGATPGTLFYCGNCLRMPEVSYVQPGDPAISNGSDRAVSEFNALIQQACQSLASIGLPTWYVDISSHYDPTTMVSSDGIQPNDLGHATIASVFLEYLQGRGRSSLGASLGQLSVYSQAGRSLLVQSTADLESWYPFYSTNESGGEVDLQLGVPSKIFFRALQQ
jgi:hypothetical protein